jgi:hypothetical protein
MALSALQRNVCLALAELRKRSGESYVAGGGALNEVVAGARRSRDVDLFHDTDAVLVQWAQDSAFRFFPLLEHEVFGLTLHPFDLATNKLLAVMGRREARDWIDVLRCHDQIQPLGYLAWAAAGKDPGFTPAGIVEWCARTRYVQAEVDGLDFDGPTPQVAEASARWHRAVAEARLVVEALPAEHGGSCVVDQRGRLMTAPAEGLPAELAAGRVGFRQGSIRGAFPELRIHQSAP